MSYDNKVEQRWPIGPSKTVRDGSQFVAIEVNVDVPLTPTEWEIFVRATEAAEELAAAIKDDLVQ